MFPSTGSPLCWIIQKQGHENKSWLEGGNFVWRKWYCLFIIHPKPEVQSLESSTWVGFCSCYPSIRAQCSMDTGALSKCLKMGGDRGSSHGLKVGILDKIANNTCHTHSADPFSFKYTRYVNYFYTVWYKLLLSWWREFWSCAWLFSRKYYDCISDKWRCLPMRHCRHYLLPQLVYHIFLNLKHTYVLKSFLYFHFKYIWIGYIYSHKKYVNLNTSLHW